MIAIRKFIAIGLFAVIIGCQLLTPRVIRSVLDATELACVLLAESTSADELMTMCRIAPDLRDAVENAIGARIAAQKAGALKSRADASPDASN
jgi:hypothetical protein